MNDDFRPLPLLGNPHVQTVLGSLMPAEGLRLPAQVHVVPLPDGDALAAHDTTPPGWHPGRPIAVLVHGLGGCHQSRYLVRLTNLLSEQGIRVVRVDLRGAGAGLRLARRLYNAACSADVRGVADFFLRDAPGSPLLLAGFSLGGSIVVKLAGEASAEPLPGLRAVAAVNPPLDMLRCSEMLARLPFYDRYYARNLRAQVQRHQRVVPDAVPVRFPRDLTVRLFDEIYTAPRGGFANALDYYEKASSLPWAPRIQVPALLVTARDDPFIPVEPFEQLSPRPGLEVHIVARGGHLGYVGRDGAGGLRWIERRVARWLVAQAGV